MEIDIWAWLTHQHSPFAINQLIPDVFVFKGCQLDGWYCSSSSGRLVRRQDATPESLLDLFCPASTSGNSIDDQAPVAILRTSYTMVDVERGATIDVPSASLLTARALRELVGRTQNGDVEADVWSVQSFVRPVDGRRILSIYSCDADGHEKSDVFSRSFHSVYSLSTGCIMPRKEEISADQCLEVSADQRQHVEAKTRSAVRFAFSHHCLALDGLVLEFVFTDSNKPLLHACWCATAAPHDSRKRLARAGTFNGDPVDATCSSPGSQASLEQPNDDAGVVGSIGESCLLTSDLASKVLQQSRVSRQSLVKRFASQLDIHHGLQQEWEEELCNAKATVQQAHDETWSRDRQAAQIRADIKTLVTERERQLVGKCRDLCNGVHDVDCTNSHDEAALLKSRGRLTKLARLEGQLHDHGQSLQSALDHTEKQFASISTSYAALQQELAGVLKNKRSLRTTSDVRNHEHTDKDNCKSAELAKLRAILAKLQQELLAEQEHAGHLEHFIRQFHK